MLRVAGIFSLGLCVALVGCGGTSSNKALEHRVGDQYLAPVPIQDRAALKEAARAVFLAEWQVRFTEHELRSAQLEVKTASNQLRSTKLEASSVQLEKKRATDVANDQRLADVGARERSTELKFASDRAHQAEAKARVAYLQARLDAERAALHSAEAELELRKARSMSSTGVQPPGFSAERYQSQRDERRGQLERANAKVRERKTSLDALTVQRKNAEAALGRQKPVAAPAADAPPTLETSQPPPIKKPPIKKPPPPPVEEPAKPPSPTVAPLNGDEDGSADETGPGAEESLDDSSSAGDQEAQP